MKKFAVLLVSLMTMGMLMFTSCSKDKLDGTTWKATITESGYTITATMEFDDGNVTLTSTMGSNSHVQKGTYTFDDPTVTITYTENGVTQTEKGTVKGKKMTFTDGSNETVFEKQ